MSKLKYGIAYVDDGGPIRLNYVSINKDEWYRINVVYPRAPLWRRLAKLVGVVTRIRRLRWISFTEGEPESIYVQREDSQPHGRA